MNVLEASTLIDTCVGLGIWPNTTPDLLADQSQVWADQLSNVPLEWAVMYAHDHGGSYWIKPSMIRGAFEEEQKRIQRGRRMYDDRACAFRNCRCSHAVGVCMRGFVDQPREWTAEERGQSTNRDGETVAIVRDVIRDAWCPTCWDARNERRMELKKDPLDIGVTGPNL